MYNGYQTFVMHNPFSRYLETHIIHNHRLFIMSVTHLDSVFRFSIGRYFPGTSVKPHSVLTKIPNGFFDSILSIHCYTLP
jgi:hypothetical protein